MKILALDLATKTGYAHNLGGPLVAGTLVLGSKAEIALWGKKRLTRRMDPRVCRLMKFIQEIPAPDVVIFEDVQFVKSQAQGQLWSALRGAIWGTFCNDCCSRTAVECVPVTTLKQFATGSGGADKVGMCRALVKCFPKRYCAVTSDTVRDLDTGAVLDDNAVDAIWLYQWAQDHLERI